MTRIIDSHHHLWNFNTEDYGWMDDTMEILRRDYSPVDLKSEIKEAGVEGTVVIQARQKLEETEWLLEIADQYDFIKGVVGWVDLRSEDLQDQLESFASHAKFVGVRHVIHDEPDDDFMLKTRFLRGIELLGDYDLAYDLLLFPKHLQNATELISMFPGQRFVLDHISKPLIKYGITAPWKEDLFLLAESPNVCCKVSGMVTEADHKRWKYNDFVAYMDIVLEAFGVERLMIGSDWPVCKLAGEYKDVLDIPGKYFSTLEEEEIEQIFRLNCAEFYKLELNNYSNYGKA